MNPQKMSETHQRVITSRVHLMEKNIIEMVQLLNEPDKSVLNRVEQNIDEKSIDEITEKLEALMENLENFSGKYRLPGKTRSQKRLVSARLNTLLNIIMDMYSRKLSGFGTFNADLEESYNDDIRKLENEIDELYQYFLNN